MSVRHDWYQNDEKVVVTVLLKNAVEKNYKCEIKENSLQITAENYELYLELFGSVAAEKSSHKATPHKIEINLMKRDFGKWTALEKKAEEAPVKVYSGKKPDEWDKLAKDIEKNEEKDEAVCITQLEVNQLV
jgi:suppressor of G2 allele of SKP1